MGWGGSGVMVAASPATVRGGGDVRRLQRRVARPVVESEMVGNDERRWNKVTKLGAPGALVKTRRLVQWL